MLGLTKHFRKLVAIRSTQNLYMLEKTLAETDPLTTDVVVMTAQVARHGDASLGGPDMDNYNRELMTAVVNRSEKAGKYVQPLIVRTNNPLFSVVQTAKELHAQELVLGVSNIYNADDQIEQIAFYWISLFGGSPEPLTVRLLSQSRDMYFDLAGGNRIPKIGERQARSVAELRSAGVGVSHVLVVHYGISASSDLFTAALTMLDPLVALSVVRIPLKMEDISETDWFEHDLQRAKQLNREVETYSLPEGDPNRNIIELTRRLECGLVVIGQLEESDFPGRKGLDFGAGEERHLLRVPGGTAFDPASRGGMSKCRTGFQPVRRGNETYACVPNDLLGNLSYARNPISSWSATSLSNSSSDGTVSGRKMIMPRAPSTANWVPG